MIQATLKHCLKKQSLVRNKHFTTIKKFSPSLANISYSNSLQLPYNCKALLGQQRSFSAETKEFRAETKQLLDIVTHSIYTDKEVFLRELISNASDALEKYRYKTVVGELKSDESADSAPLEINIITDKKGKTLTICDNGIGMSKDELVNNLGTIARSGSKEFVKNLITKDKSSADSSSPSSSSNSNASGIIGQFGVGFYSSFMVSDKVTVESLPATAATGEDASSGGSNVHKWVSDGTGTFTIETVPSTELSATSISTQTMKSGHGSIITMTLKDTCMDFVNEATLKEIIKKYSNFVAFPIKLNGETINTVTALWTQDKKDVTEKQYAEFYKFIANAYDEPRYTLHFRTDAPIDLKCLFFIPFYHTEKFGQGRMEPGVNLYSRKVVIESKPKDLLPDWLRFVKGVVDSEDLPLSLSREKPQDTKLLRRIKEVVTRKIIKYLEDQLKGDSQRFREFFNEYAFFIKEGICTDSRFSEQISKLLMFQSSTMTEGELTTLDEYITRCPPEQKDIYYIVSPTRNAALTSPYMELFQKHNKEVLFLFNSIDDFVMTNLKQYNGRKLISVEKSDIDFDQVSKKSDEKKDTSDAIDKSTNETDKDKESNESITNSTSESSNDSSSSKLSEMESTEVCGWLKFVLGGERVTEVRVTHRLSDSPAIVTDHESGALRKMLKMVEHSASAGMMAKLPPQVLEINPKHPIIKGLYNAINATRTSTRNEAINDIINKGKTDVDSIKQRLNDKFKKKQSNDSTTTTAVEEIPDAEIVSDQTTATATTASEGLEPSLQQVESMAKLIAEQVYDNALIAAGLADDPRSMLTRLNKILTAVIPSVPEKK